MTNVRRSLLKAYAAKESDRFLDHGRQVSFPRIPEPNHVPERRSDTQEHSWMHSFRPAIALRRFLHPKQPCRHWGNRQAESPGHRPMLVSRHSQSR